MTISSQTRKAGPYTGNGSNTSFPFTFKVFQASDVVVVRTTSGVESTLVLGTDYTVTLNANQNSNPGGTVTTTSAPASGVLITLTSSVAYTQSVDLTNQGGFYPSVINDALDKATIQIQQINEQIGRSVKAPISSTLVSGTLPYPQALTLIGWDNLGTSFKNYTPSELGISVAYAQWQTQRFSGTGAQTAFVLTNDAGVASNIDVRIGGVPQTPDVDFIYTQASKTVTFTTAPGTGTNNIVMRYGQALAQAIIGDGTVTMAKIAATGTPSSSTYLRGDGVWATVVAAAATPTVAGMLYGKNDNSSLTFVGYNAGAANSTGGFNTAIGTLAMAANTSASQNTAMGYGALYNNTTGYNNTALGNQAMQTTNGGNGNVAIGDRALYSNQTGSSNVAIGGYVGAASPLYNNLTGSFNVAVGEGALKTSTAASNNTAVGWSALTANTSGTRNVALGYQAGNNITTATDIVAIGYQAGSGLSAASTGPNLAIGANTLAGVGTGFYNVTVGHQGLNANTDGRDNVAVGYQAMLSNTTGNYNVAMGTQVLQTNTAGGSNTGVGYRALYNNGASNNTAVGYSSLFNNTSGNSNVAVGYQALNANSSANKNTAIGMGALYFSNRTADTNGDNTGVGYNAGSSITTGQQNTCVGSATAAVLTTGSNNTVIGYGNSTSAAAASNQIVIGSGVTGQADSNVTIGSAAGKIYNPFTVSATWTQTSDGRLKTNVQDDSLGLSFVNRLRTVKFNWKPSNEIDPSLPYYNEVNQRDTQTVIHGLIAQEVKAALDAEGVNTFAGWDQGPDGIQAISREMFVSPLIKAVQELSAQVDALKAEIAALKAAQ